MNHYSIDLPGNRWLNPCLNADGSENDIFISYDDERACAAKVTYARDHHLGGLMIFDLGNGYRPFQSAGEQDPLLKTIKKSLFKEPITTIQPWRCAWTRVSRVERRRRTPVKRLELGPLDTKLGNHPMNHHNLSLA